MTSAGRSVCVKTIGATLTLTLVFYAGMQLFVDRDGPDHKELSFVSYELLESFPSTGISEGVNASLLDDLPKSGLVCKLPKLLVNDPSIQQYIVEKKPIRCAAMANWVYTANSSIWIKPEAVKKYGKIYCNYYAINRVTDTTHKLSPGVQMKNGHKIATDAFRIDCKSSSGHRYRNVHASVLPREETKTRTPKPGRIASDAGLNVLIYPLDSMSRVNFLRKLPKFYSYLNRDLKPAIFEGFNIVGDGTPWTMIPMLTGYFQPELNEARKRFANATFLDKWPLIFYEYARKAGFITSFADEQPQYGFFTYKLKGFKVQPTDHYLMPYEFAINQYLRENLPYCLGDTPRCELLLRWWTELQDVYRPLGRKTFSLLFESELSHDDYNLIQVMDDRFVKRFSKMHAGGYFNDTFLILMGDHGRRFGAVRQTQSGRTEEKMPFLAIYTPLWWREKYPRCWANLMTNTQRLMTPFDLHATLQHLIDFEGGAGCGIGNLTSRQISLFDEIPEERTCGHAGIRPHFCSCQSWIDIQPGSQAANWVSKFVVDQFNALLTPTGNNCVPLVLNSTLWARKLLPNKAMMSFKQSLDHDNINPVLTADTTVSYILYQVRVRTSPNDGDYEVTVHYYLKGAAKTPQKRPMLKFSPDLVSRLNAYSDQPHCIMKTHHQLRPYCICPDKVGQRTASLIEDI